MKLILISGDGHGAGKTYLARRLTDGQHQLFSVANLIRHELARKYPGYEWYNKDPHFKTSTMVKETKKSIHQMLDETGRSRKKTDPLYWAKELVNLLSYARDTDKRDTVVVDDVRFVDEYIHIKTSLQSAHVVHLHVINPKAKPEPNYENEKLKELADYWIEARHPPRLIP